MTIIIFRPFYNNLMRDKPWGYVIASPAAAAKRLRKIRRA